MFLGEYQLKFSGKGRVILPKKMRDQISGGIIVLSRGFESCIFGFDIKVWEKEAEKQLEISATEERARYLRRYLFSAGVSVEFDSQGRFIVPSALLTFARLVTDVTIIGAGDHFEIWNTSNWKKHLKEILRDYARVS